MAPACFLRHHWSLVAPGGWRLEEWQQGQVQGLDRWALLAPARGTRGPLAEGFRHRFPPFPSLWSAGPAGTNTARTQALGSQVGVCVQAAPREAGVSWSL